MRFEITGRTGVLLAIIVGIVLIHYFPRAAPLIWVVVVLAGGAWLVRTALVYLRYFKHSKAQAAQRAADDIEYGQYEQQLAALRADATLTADAFDSRLAALQDRHRALLTRRFGPH